mmetsp:Transcript_1469/g.3055  ORF Transcript_1469/g.3055 Transcript_1469/m.3055 type:complete len:313 (-) Transcript_1469:549-1487(-)
MDGQEGAQDEDKKPASGSLHILDLLRLRVRVQPSRLSARLFEVKLRHHFALPASSAAGGGDGVLRQRREALQDRLVLLLKRLLPPLEIQHLQLRKVPPHQLLVPLRVVLPPNRDVRVCPYTPAVRDHVPEHRLLDRHQLPLFKLLLQDLRHRLLHHHKVVQQARHCAIDFVPRILQCLARRHQRVLLAHVLCQRLMKQHQLSLFLPAALVRERVHNEHLLRAPLHRRPQRLLLRVEKVLHVRPQNFPVIKEHVDFVVRERRKHAVHHRQQMIRVLELLPDPVVENRDHVHGRAQPVRRKQKRGRRVLHRLLA